VTLTNTTTAAKPAEHGVLTQAMKPALLAMLSLGGAIGAGLFVGSRSAIGVAGPALLVFAAGMQHGGRRPWPARLLLPGRWSPGSRRPPPHADPAGR
jgi:hypothetical protein